MNITKKDLGSDEIKVKEIMSSPIISIDINSDVNSAVDLMVEKGIFTIYSFKNFGLKGDDKFF